MSHEKSSSDAPRPESTKPESVKTDPRIEFFDRIAAVWDHEEQDPLDTVRRMNEVRDRLELKPGMDLLEVGCGTGQLTGWLVEQVAPGKVMAIDFSAKMLEKVEGKKIEADFRQIDVCEPNLSAQLDDTRFDVVLCFHSFPHFRDQVGALQNLISLLKPGGRLMVMHLKSPEQINDYHRQVDGIVSIDLMPEEQADWQTLLAQVGLVETDWIKQDDLFLLVAQRRGS